MIDWDKKLIGPLLGVFGEAVVHSPRNGIPQNISGVFDNAYLKDVMFEDGSSSTTEVHAVLGVQTSTLEFMPAQNDQIYIVRTAATYVVKDVHFDGRGTAKLILSKASQW